MYSSDPRRCYNDSILRHHTESPARIPNIFKAFVYLVLCDLDAPSHRKGGDADGGSVCQSCFHGTKAVGFSHIARAFLQCRVSRSVNISVVQTYHANCITSTKRKDFPLRPEGLLKKVKQQGIRTIPSFFSRAEAGRQQTSIECS